jgi:hypothetical protein
MRRIVVITAALTVLCGGAAASRAADAPNTGAPVARLVSCDLTGSDRSAVFYGRLDAIPGATRLALRFSLLEKLGRDRDFSKVDVPALRQWHRSSPGVTSYGYKQTVDNLRARGAYKARVQYRWTTAAGDLVASDVRDTPVCRGPLPNLSARGLDVRPGPTPDTRTYRVTIANDGKGAADAVDVVLSVDRAVLDTTTIDHLDAGASRAVTFTGPACKGGVRVRVDPDNTVDELVEGDNTQLYDCPA